MPTRGARTEHDRACWRGRSTPRRARRHRARHEARRRSTMRIAARRRDAAVGAAAADARAGEHARALVEAGLVAARDARGRARSRSPTRAHRRRTRPPTLTAGAGGARWRPSSRRWPARRYAPFLLHGVTGSGKTEVYLRVIARGARARAGRAGAGARDRAHAAAGGALSRRASATTWRCCTAGSPTASARAMPGGACARGEVAHRARRALGGVRAGRRPRRRRRRRGARRLVQAGGGRALPRARPGGGARAARRRGGAARLGDAVAGDARRRARRARSALLELPERATRAAAARRSRSSTCKRAPPGRRRCSRAPLADALDETLAAGEQAILFLNRRGFSTFVAVRGVRPRRCAAAHCSVALTYHRGARPACSATTAASRARAAELCPPAARRRSSGWASAPSRWRRWCASASRRRASRGSIATPRAATGLERRARRGCARGEIDILVGTQMVTKGHDFPGRDPGRRGARRPGAGPARLPRRRSGPSSCSSRWRGGPGAASGRGACWSDATAARTRQSPARATTTTRASPTASWRARGEPRLSAVHAAWPACASTAPIRSGARYGDARRRSGRGACAKQAPAEVAATVLGPAEAPLSRLKGRTRWQLFLQSSEPRRLARPGPRSDGSGRPEGGPPQHRHRPHLDAVIE